MGAGVGALAGWLVWLWRWPFVGYDSMLQNLLTINHWLHDGHPGSQHRVLAMAPVEAFPMTNDVLLSWGSSFTRSFAVVAPWALTATVLLVLSLVALIRSLAVPPLVGSLAIASVVTIPHVVGLANTAKSDLPALAWLACAAALVVGARDHPQLLPAALLAAGLSIGSKTTTAPLVAVVVALGLWAHRGELRRHGPLVLAGIVGAGVVGGVWYLRNLVDHGSPVWPLGTTRWGDPLPPLFQHAGDTFLDAPGTVVRTQWRDLAGVAAGGLVLAPLGVVTGLLVGPRLARLLALAGLLALALWVISPVTGVSNAPLAGDVLTSTSRYLLPADVLGAVTLAVCARRSRVAPIVTVVLVALVLGNLVAIAVHEGQGEVMPAPGYVLVGAALVALAALAPWPARRGGSRSWAVAAPAMAVVGLLAAGVLVSADGWTARHRQVLYFGGHPVDALLVHPQHRAGTEPVLVTNIAWSDLAGDDLAHEVRLLPPGVSCEALEAAVGSAWLVLVDQAFLGEPDRPLARGCLDGVAALATDGTISVFAPGSAGAAGS